MRKYKTVFCTTLFSITTAELFSTLSEEDEEDPIRYNGVLPLPSMMNVLPNTANREFHDTSRTLLTM
ncbi:hypothetical protein DQ04_14771020 [Trypanosoma grayi]|uniref:hypothetical protein n=1 Tax=Trypanosoma grayi TaxID=71804 RepID=UPI0004F48040|nr:hypothetical protein DQ04_14771020 [Trypanosoma grayi]KEG06297.1 hypothetical protein DQ04_14771020 [Trypanosoma grayi]